ncbi:tRNA (adenosine(37)-N6)-threonylcarbamoyltransferase complex ATPase subunit type 1 TsaE [Psychrobacter phenylpyruvicus]|uniref:tRNA threonylcarbamoyladenosine biosynthesis protein TsaE n=1 Tax=Psychrobacter phenylpyruvicus TaxID=29432 RepID=A0A379LM89_9GAMM|nr:tRNA (adenosine(37)-N6)-threonylcarbamoyltransferase complex ATPase subunit type 1 TsaE [Psychrobacter phenylpyruvicus]SUD91215.1 ADP-binding protein [Psychrobacter phenylpyruvicus]
MASQHKEIILKSEADTEALAQQLAKANLTGSVWLSGDLGAGKTTLTRYWLKALGHKGSVKSPTYTLVEPYELAESNNALIQRVYHADLYRLQDPEELSFIGFEEYLEDDKALVIIEWASRAEGYLPQPIMTVDIMVTTQDGEQVRRVNIQYEEGISFDEP